jgi:signal peptidase I
MMNKVMKEIINTLLYLLGVLCLTWLLITFVGQRTEVDGSSMEPTLSNGDNLLVDKISYRFREPERFDIIVFSFKYKEDTYFIKRIIGLPGETVWIDEKGNIYIDGELLEESYGKEIISADKIGIAGEPIVVGEDEYFVLGDNRNNSKDSRTTIVGNVKKKDIIGRAFVRLWPLDKMKTL